MYLTSQCYTDDVDATQDYDVGDVILRIIKCLVMDRYRDLKSCLSEIENNNKIDFLALRWLTERAGLFLLILGTDTDHVYSMNTGSI